jgi:hypothetical protein
MAPVRPNVGHLIGDNEVMLDIDGALHIVTDHPAAPAPVAIERASGSACLRCASSDVQSVQALYLLTRRRNLLIERWLVTASILHTSLYMAAISVEVSLRGFRLTGMA